MITTPTATPPAPALGTGADPRCGCVVNRERAAWRGLDVSKVDFECDCF